MLGSATGPGLLRRQLARLQRRGRFDVWHVHAAHLAGWAAVDALRGLGVPGVQARLTSDPTPP